jgi:predicted branched-subunit amino acid permease
MLERARRGSGLICAGLWRPGSAPSLLKRRYEPAAPFSLFFLFCTFVWKSLNDDRRRSLAWAAAASLALVILIFSYFFLWTAAFAGSFA